MRKYIVTLTEEEYQDLLARANREYGYDADKDFNPMDYSGGNFDDCYEMGKDHADADAAQEILNLLTTRLD